MRPAKLFRNRTHAGRQLAQALPAGLHHSDALVLALPRGGVPVGFAVAKELELELDILLVRKLGLPGHEEFAMGALGSGGVRVLQPEVLRRHNVSDAALDAVCARELAEIARRERQFRGDRPAPRLQGRTVILVDDGLATGSTMRAAIEVARAGKPASIVVAAPVGAPSTCAALAPEVDQLVCLVRPPGFLAVSQCYLHFEQTSDDEVQDLLALAWRKRALRQYATHG
jgi:putative phosphoribosyl transferase